MTTAEIFREINYICLFILALMIVGLLCAKKKTLYNYLVIFLYAVMGFVVFASWNTLPDLSFAFPVFALYDMVPLYCVGPVFYFLFTYMHSGRPGLSHWLHFAPAAVALALSLPYYLQPAETKRYHLREAFLNGVPAFVDVLFAFAIIITALYIIVIMVRYRHLMTPAILKAEPNLIVVTFILGMAIISVSLGVMSIVTKDYIYFRLAATSICVELTVFFILNYRNPQLIKGIVSFSNNPDNFKPLLKTPKGKSGGHPLDHILNVTMADKKPFLDQNLSLAMLAEAADVSIHVLSQYLNQHLNQNFYQYINSFRLDEAKRLLRETKMSSIEVAFNTGFNSKATFNRTFKNETGMTPGQYREAARG